MSADETPLQPGEIREAETRGLEVENFEPPKVDPIEKQKARTSSLLAYIVVLGLLGFLLIYFITLLFITVGQPNRADTLQDFFNTALPVLSGLAGSAIAYFLGSENKNP